jgi:CheY-like chemotaxis protein
MAPHHPRRVLVIDDDDDLRENVVECLEAKGFSCWSAASADHAVALLAHGGAAPDLILTDLSMPGLAVGRFLAFLGRTPVTAGVPVLVMTGVSDRHYPTWLDPAIVLEKPFNVATLLSAASMAIADRHRQLGLGGDRTTMVGLAAAQ